MRPSRRRTISRITARKSTPKSPPSAARPRHDAVDAQARKRRPPPRRRHLSPPAPTVRFHRVPQRAPRAPLASAHPIPRRLPWPTLRTMKVSPLPSGARTRRPDRATPHRCPMVPSPPPARLRGTRQASPRLLSRRTQSSTSLSSTLMAPTSHQARVCLLHLSLNTHPEPCHSRPPQNRGTGLGINTRTVCLRLPCRFPPSPNTRLKAGTTDRTMPNTTHHTIIPDTRALRVADGTVPLGGWLHIVCLHAICAFLASASFPRFPSCS